MHETPLDTSEAENDEGRLRSSRGGLSRRLEMRHSTSWAALGDHLRGEGELGHAGDAIGEDRGALIANAPRSLGRWAAPIAKAERQGRPQGFEMEEGRGHGRVIPESEMQV